jgi:hypothetical protein
LAGAVAIGVVLVLGASACSSDDGGSAASAPSLSQPAAPPASRPSKDDFVRQANQICQDFNQQMAALGDQLGDEASLDALVTAYRDTALPAFRRAVDKITALGFPIEDDAALRTLFGDIDAAIKRVESNPQKELQDSDDPFESVNQRLTDYGLDSCAP